MPEAHHLSCSDDNAACLHARLTGIGVVLVHRYPLGIWIGIAFSVALAASALYWDSSRVILGPASSWATIAQLNAEYREATKHFVLPDGHEWPTATPYPATSSDGVQNNYAAGLGGEWAAWYWFDACAAVAVSSTESTAARQAAIEQLPKFYKTQAFLTAEDPKYYRNIIGPTQNGDLTALREYVDSLDPAMRNGE